MTEVPAFDSGFFFAESIRNAATAAYRAEILLQLPDQVLADKFQLIEAACRECNFELGQRFATTRVASFSAVRTADGRLPSTIARTLALLTRLMRQTAGGSR